MRIYRGYTLTALWLLAATAGYAQPAAEATVIPEPSTFILLGSGIAGLVYIVATRRKKD